MKGDGLERISYLLQQASCQRCCCSARRSVGCSTALAWGAVCGTFASRERGHRGKLKNTVSRSKSCFVEVHLKQALNPQYYSQ
jgi:hypothetical protein